MVNMLKVLVAVVILLLIVGLAMLGKKVIRSLRFRSAKTPRNESLVLEWITGLLVVGISIANYVRQDPAGTWVMGVGAVIFFLGGLLQLTARKQLYEDATFEDRLSSGFSAAQVGLYSKLRYPSKTALLLLLIGLCLSVGSWWGLGLLAILFFPSLLYRISQEEQVLQDKFGERWIAYKADTKTIIPGIL